MSSRFSDVIDRVKNLKEVEEGKQIELEANDMKALLIAAFEVFGPILLGMLLFFAVVITILVQLWG